MHIKKIFFDQEVNEEHFFFQLSNYFREISHKSNGGLFSVFTHRHLNNY